MFGFLSSYNGLVEKAKNVLQSGDLDTAFSLLEKAILKVPVQAPELVATEVGSF